MSDKLLSICIPIFNRLEIFRNSIMLIETACKGYEEFVEIVISDNNSEDDFSVLVSSFIENNPKIDLVYSVNTDNFGLAFNILQSVKLANGIFCWVIGSDDFINNKALFQIIEILKKDDIDFLSFNFNKIDISEIMRKGSFNTDNSFFDKFSTRNISDLESKYLVFDELLNPNFNNVMLGSVMLGIFRKSLWNDSFIDLKEIHHFNSVESMYPHVSIFARNFLGKRAYYLSSSLIYVGDGTREWATDLGNSYASSSLPLIYTIILPQIIEMYHSYGLSKNVYTKCKNWTTTLVGKNIIPIFINRHILKRNIKNGDLIKIYSILKNNYLSLYFYKGILIYLYKIVSGIFSKLNYITKKLLEIT